MKSTRAANPIPRRDLALTLGGGALVLLGFLAAYALHRWTADPPRVGRALFSPWLNNLSTLGWTRDAIGQDNRPAAWIFALSLTGAGLLFVHFWGWRRRLVTTAGLRRAVGVCGGLMGVFLLLVGLLPENLFPRLHNLMIFPPVLLGALAILGCYLGPDPGLESRRARRATQGVIAVAFLTAVTLKGAVLLEWLPRQPALPVMQKILILLLGAWTLRQAAILRRSMGPAAMKSARSRPAVIGAALVGLGLLSAQGATELPPLVVVAPPGLGQTVERFGDQPVGRPGLDWVRQGGAGGQSDLRLFGSAYNAGGYSLGGLALENPQTEHFHAWLPLPAHWFSAPRLLSATEQTGLTQGHLAGTLALELDPVLSAGSAQVAGGSRGYQRQTLALSSQQAVGAGPLALAFERERRPNADRLGNDQEAMLGALRWGHVGPEGQLDVLAGSSWRRFGAQGYYGVSPALPAEETVTDHLVLAQARFAGGPGHPLRASLLWRETTDAYRLTLPAAPLFANDHQARQVAALLAGQTPLSGLAPAAPLRPALDWRLTAEQQTLDSNALGDHHRGRLTALVLPRLEAFRWALSGGVEAQGLSRERPVVLPQAALEWRLPARQLLRLAYAETLRRPSYTELNYESPASLGQAGLANERAETWEATVRGQTADRRLSWSVGAFRRVSRQAVDWVLAGPESARWTAENLERLRVHGALTELQYAPWDWLRVTVGGQWLRKQAAVTPYASRYQLDYPEWRGDLAVIVSPGPRWRCALRQTWSAHAENPARAGRNAESQGRLEWAWQPVREGRWTIEAGLDNLWNDAFEPAPGTPAARRLLTAGLRATW